MLPDARAPRILVEASHSAYVKVSEGCNHRCAFCIIPKIRGRHESRPIDDVRRRGRGTGRGGRARGQPDRPGPDRLRARSRRASRRSPDCFAASLACEGIDWIRLLYCYPNFVTDELLETIATEPKVCPYIDMPLQHGSDRMLRAMRRERSAQSLRRAGGASARAHSARRAAHFVHRRLPRRDGGLISTSSAPS